MPSRAEIQESAILSYNLLTARAPGPGKTQAEWRVRAMEADSKYWSHAARLSKMLLGPVASQLGQLGKKRLIIVADGALHYVPFAALPVPSIRDGEDQKSEAGAQPLIVEHEIVSLPSASTLAALRRETAGRKKAEKSLAVLADPVFTDNELFYDYAQGKLSPSDRKQFEKHFLTSERNRRRVTIASALAQKISEAVPSETTDTHLADRKLQSPWQSLKSFFSLQSVAVRFSLAALIMALLGSIWLATEIVKLRTELDQFRTDQTAREAQLQQQTQQERARADELNPQSKRFSPPSF